jgi:ring-1,2-phenylacetyl-CoA epoxidase subunit PaaD
MCGAELQTREAAARAVLATVPDPELPALSLVDLGIVREVLTDEDGRLHVVLTPTYSGCPATEVITQSVLTALAEAGLGPAQVSHRLAPAWTTDWISEAGKEKLLAYGIAPPGPALLPGSAVLHFRPRPLACPRCASLNTERLSAFGSTACKALHRCLACREPFEHFKPI